VSQAWIAGFYGKLPARGDFVRFALPRDFTDPWDAWLSDVIGETRRRAPDDWLAAFLEAPVWRFILPAGLCGARAALGLMLPSVDRAGRYYPLTFAALCDSPGPAAGPSADAWLDMCEAAGRDALQNDTSPDWIAAALAAPDLPATGEPVTASEWWTEGAPRVPAGHFSSQTFPSAAVYAEMLGIVLQPDKPG